MKKISKNHPIIEWLCRVLFTINLYFVAMNYYDGLNYPMNVIALIALALWLYFFNIKIISVIILMLALLINYLHIGVTAQQ
jgi:hypothetical protein